MFDPAENVDVVLGELVLVQGKLGKGEKLSKDLLEKSDFAFFQAGGFDDLID
jgi:hypothetical protein